MDTRETTRDCKGRKYCSPSSQLISCVVSLEKRLSGTHCSLIAKQEEKTVLAKSTREIKVKGKMEKRTERESDRRRKVTDLLVLP